MPSYFLLLTLVDSNGSNATHFPVEPTNVAAINMKKPALPPARIQSTCLESFALHFPTFPHPRSSIIGLTPPPPTSFLHAERPVTQIINNMDTPSLPRQAECQVSRADPAQSFR
jgi:hypothetical protein